MPVEGDDKSDTQSVSSMSDASGTTFLSESIMEYRKLVGRAYHYELGDAEAWTPNDGKHKDSMELT